MTSPGLDITQLLANLRKKTLESQGTPPEQDKPPMDQNKLMSIIAGGSNQGPMNQIAGAPQTPGGRPFVPPQNTPPPTPQLQPPPEQAPQPIGPPPGVMSQIAGGDLGSRPSGPAMLDFQKMIPQEPMKSDPNLQPSGKRKFAAVMAGIGSGILNRNVGPAMDAYRTVRNAPFNQAEGEYKQKLGNLAKSANVEQVLDEQKRKETLGTAQVGEFGARREAEVERAGAEKARRISEEQKSSPEFIKGQREFELEKERIGHPTKTEKPTTFTDLEIAIRSRANELGVDPDNLPYAEVKKIEDEIGQRKKEDKNEPFNMSKMKYDTFVREHGRIPTGAELDRISKEPKDDSVAFDRRTDSTKTRLRRPHDKTLLESSSQLDRINEAEGMLTGPTAESGALATIKVITALVSGTGTGVRVTMPEINTVANARGFTGSVESFIQGLQGQTKFTPQQVKELQQILGDVKGLVSKKQKALNDGISKIEDSNSPQEASKAEAELRTQLMGLSEGVKSPQGGESKIRVKRKSDGQTGNLLEKDFNPEKYDRIQ